MRLVKLLVSLVFTLLLGLFMQWGWSPLPPPGSFFHPIRGFWTNAEPPEGIFPQGKISHAELQDTVEVFFDERMVPHIYARNESDLFFAQGYVTAQMRLWQMDFIARAAAGRIAEAAGEVAIEFDLNQRRKGMGYAAEASLHAMESDPTTRHILNRYTAGVNAYIENLGYSHYPLEYKIMDFKPEPWTSLKTAYILKYFADLLTGKDQDLPYTRAEARYGSNAISAMYPDTAIFPGAAVLKQIRFQNTQLHVDTPSVKHPNFLPVSVPEPGIESDSIEEKEDPVAEPPAVGSNNWAITGNRSFTGKPMLANDPHLPLMLPSLWLEMHLSAPGYHVRGVSIPGTPTIIIGFNEALGWGLTNGTQDVKDWYEVTFKDKNQEEYLYDQQWLPVNYREEWIYIKNKKPLKQKVGYTFYGPITYTDTLIINERRSLAMRWTGHEAGNELKSFYRLNKSETSQDVESAMRTFVCPAQNLVFATHKGEVGVIQFGLFPLRWKGQGKTVMLGEIPSNHWQGYVPEEWMVREINPQEGFVQSANQHPFESSFPLYYTGRFEQFRNHRISKVLRQAQKWQASNMKQLQLDEYSVLASMALPVMLKQLVQYRPNTPFPPEANTWIDSLKNWNYQYEANSSVPTFFHAWFRLSLRLAFDEYYLPGLMLPQDAVLVYLLIHDPKHPIFNRGNTSRKELASDIIVMAAKRTLAQFPKPDFKYAWGRSRQTRLRHLAELAPFHSAVLYTGGEAQVINAITGTHGPSWRMLYTPGDSIAGWGIFPGGQSGNPGSPFYNNQTPDWVSGQYYALNLDSQSKMQEKPNAVLHLFPLK